MGSSNKEAPERIPGYRTEQTVIGEKGRSNTYKEDME